MLIVIFLLSLSFEVDLSRFSSCSFHVLESDLRVAGTIDLMGGQYKTSAEDNPCCLGVLSHSR